MANTLKSLFLMRSRAYAATADKVKLRSTVPMISKVVAESTETNTTKKEVFWMRDPKTGNWMPENHFAEVNVAELREKLLSKKPRCKSYFCD
ncbi:hypothetical protein C2S52_003786 [Perilla frutescens var. hirtella]|nr:hypothetical protein C2S52_003786 [Perilla frutescens var. hirtella]